MKIVMTILVRNEDDIIRENIEYHLNNGVDHFIITDHHSTDNTPNILREYEKKGVVEFLVETSNEHHQALWVSEMARKAYEKYGADWVINNDADEFWVPQKGNIKDFFESIDDDVYKLHVSRFDFFYNPYRDIKFYDAMLFREFVKKWTKCCHRGVSDIVVEVGNHDANSKSMQEKYRALENIIDLIIFHFPVRTRERYMKKMIEGTASVMNTPGIPSEMFFHWKRALQYISENRFDDYIKEYSKTIDEINDGIRNWKIVFDDRIQKFFKNMPV